MPATHTLRSVALSSCICCAIAITGATAPALADIKSNVPDNLTRIYRGSDGSALYTRAVGTTVVGFGEGTGRAFVFTGELSGTIIEGRWWDVAKGPRESSGALRLRYSKGGSTLKRSGGDDLGPESWQAKSIKHVVWPKPREAGFQSTAANDLDGAFAGTDGSRAYVRQTAQDVVWFAEEFQSPKAKRPSYATVVIAKRSKLGVISGKFYDLPKGKRSLKRGRVLAVAGSAPRTFTHSLTLGETKHKLPRAKSYAADYAVDIGEFAKEIEKRLAPFVVGFAYAIAADGKVVSSGGGGARRIPQTNPDNGVTTPLAFNRRTVNEIASTTKLVTLVAVARALAKRGKTLDTKIDAYLPPNWVRGPGMTTVTFRQMLSHGTSAGVSNGLFKPGNCKTDFYGCLEDAVAGGMTVAPGYDNIHYTLFRVILPLITDRDEMLDLFATETDEVLINEHFSDAYRDEIHGLLKDRVGVDADFEFPPTLNKAFGYTWGTPPTAEIAPVGSEDDYLQAGSGGLKMDVIEYAKFLTVLEGGGLISPELLQEIKELGFGQDTQISGTGGIGPLYGKAGGVGGRTGTFAMVFPGDVQVFISRNSTGNPAQIGDDRMLRSAWQQALVN